MAGGFGEATLSRRRETRRPQRDDGDGVEYRAPAAAAAGHGGLPAAIRARHDVGDGRLGARLGGSRRWRVSGRSVYG